MAGCSPLTGLYLLQSPVVRQSAVPEAPGLVPEAAGVIPTADPTTEASAGTEPEDPDNTGHNKDGRTQME